MKKPIQLLCATLASSALINSMSIPRVANLPDAIQFDQVAMARRSGGRSSGGSFSRSRSSGSSSSSGSSQRSRGSDSGGSYQNRGGYYGGGYYGGGYYRSSTVDFIIVLAVLLLIGGIGLYYVISMLKSRKPKAEAEIDNDIVTVSKIQVGLLATGRAIQTQLAEIVQNADTATPDGLHAELQEAVLALLRMPENWSHVRASSVTVKSRLEAEKKFKALSIAERTKYTDETLSNVGGSLMQKAYELDPEKDPASYIVVTLLIGTADDKPLFEEVRTMEALTEVLKKFASLNSDYLMVFELLWTPEAEGDSLTYDEMISEYPDLLQI